MEGDLGEFGWRRIYFSGAMRWAIGISCLVALAGLVWCAVLIVRSGAAVVDPVPRPRRWQRRGLGFLVATVVLMQGLRALIPPQSRTYGQAGVLLALLLLNEPIFTQYVVPLFRNGQLTQKPRQTAANHPGPSLDWVSTYRSGWST